MVNLNDISPQVIWSTNPGQVIAIDESIPYPEFFNDPVERAAAQNRIILYEFKTRIKNDRHLYR